MISAHANADVSSRMVRKQKESRGGSGGITLV